MPPTSNANYGWILHIVFKLSQNGVAGFCWQTAHYPMMGLNLKLDSTLLNNLVEAIIILPRNLFYTTDISVTL